MKRLFKPWLLALVSASLLHGIFFFEFKDAHWGVEIPDRQPSSQLNVTLLPQDAPVPAVEQSSNSDTTAELPTESNEVPAQPETPTATDTQPDTNTEPLQEEVTAEETTTENTSVETSATEASSTETINDPESTPSSETTEEQSTLPETIVEKEKLSPPVQLQDISEPDTTTADTDLKAKSLLDIGSAQTWQDKADIKGQPFSKKLRDQIKQAEREQTRYEKGIVEQKHYDITEDADGTKYVNINGICWKMPEPGAEEEWKVVLSGCSGQKRSFRFELNITTDLLTPEQLQMLPFGNQE
ncbi:hypothetical protein ACFQ45_12305 [Rhodanobacter aciditrophus]|uniref:Uncharacterized protein n=1 Tax=Rhodanobacter aciditrophus TaxID=1623218 RepID=A0ABW4B262_9GAMM